MDHHRIPVPARRLGARFEDALAYAAHLHRAQTRNGTSVPYVSHLLGVASLVIEHGGDEDQAIAALLHDAAEDQGGRAQLGAIAARFGGDVAAIVEGCTDTLEMPRPPWRARKEAYVAAIAGKPARVRLVSVADKVHNARAILLDCHTSGSATWERFSGGRSGVLWYYRALADAFAALDGGRPLVGELGRTVTAIERLAASGQA